ncbi:MAG: MFS transporter [Candidatus Sericytochromatia bacterium]
MNSSNSAKRLKSNIGKLYAYWFFQGLIFAYVTERLFGLERGLTIEQMVYVEITYAAASVLLEVPTGVLADRWGRKPVLVLSAGFAFLEIFVLIFAHNFWGFALSALCAAVAGALASGTGNALFYDSLKGLGREEEFEKVIGRNRVFDYGAGIIAALGGAWVAAHYNLTLTYWISLAGIVISLGIGLSLHEPSLDQLEPEEAETASSSSLQHLLTAARHLSRHASLRFVLLYATVIGATIVYIDEYAQIYLQQVGLPIGLFGAYYLLRLSLDGGMSALAYRLKNWLSERQIFAALIVLATGSALLTALTPNLLGIGWLLLSFLAYGLAYPLLVGFLHHRTDSHHRATVESLQTAVLSMASVGIGLGFGHVATAHGILAGFFLLGCLLGGYALCYLLGQWKYLQPEPLKTE